MNTDTYIRIEVKGSLSDKELESLKVLLQEAADDVVQGTQDFYNNLPEEERT